MSLLEGYGWRPLDRRRRRPDGRARAPRGRARRGSRRDRRCTARGPRRRCDHAAAVADDRAPHTEGLDLPEGGRRAPDRGNVALAPGARLGGAPESRAPAHPRDVAAQLSPGGAVRRGRPPHRRARRARARRRASHEREPARERRDPPARSRPAGLPGLRGDRRRARHDVERGDARARRLPPRRHRAERRQLPSLRPRRDRVEPARRRVRRDRPRVGRRDAAAPTTISRRTAV